MLSGVMRFGLMRLRGASAPALLGAALAATLTAQAQDLVGDAARGRAIVASRQVGLCLLCHSAPIAEERLQGNLAPDLAGVGARYTTAQLRQRIADSASIDPQSIMPGYLRTEGLTRVGRNWQGKPLFTPQQVEDVVAYLATLR